MTWEIPDTNVADYDQHHAEAIDRLRRAPVFFVAVPVEDSWDEDEHTARIMMMGGGPHFDLFFTAVRAGIAGAGDGELEELVTSMRKWRKVDRWLRIVLIGAIGINLATVAIHLWR